MASSPSFASSSNLVSDSKGANMDPVEVDKDLEAQTNELKALGINIVDQTSLEKNVEAAVDKAMVKHSRKQKLQILKREIKDSKPEIIKLRNKKKELEFRLEGMRQRLTDPRQYLEVEKNLSSTTEKLKSLNAKTSNFEQAMIEVNENEAVLDELDLDLEDGEILDVDEAEDAIGNEKQKMSEREQMIKEGKMTPFGTVVNNLEVKGDILKSLLNAPRTNKTREYSSKTHAQLDEDESFRYSLGQHSHFSSQPVPHASHQGNSGSQKSDFEKYLQDQIDKQNSHSHKSSIKKRKINGDQSYGIAKKRKTKPKEFFGTMDENAGDKLPKKKSSKGKKAAKSPLKPKILHPKRHWKEKNIGSVTSERESDQHKRPAGILSEHVALASSDNEVMNSSESEYVPSEEEEEDLFDEERKKKKFLKESFPDKHPVSRSKKKATIKRVAKVVDDGHLENYIERIKQWKKERLKEKMRKISEDDDDGSDDEDSYERFEGGYKIPLSIWNKLYKYQKTCVKWLWELHCQNCGGILGDEMGLGKTVMVISFLVGLSYSGMVDPSTRHKGLGPVLVVSPATVLHQWVREFHRWWPPFRVAVLHDSGGFSGKRSTLIHNINKHDGILITSYQGVIGQLKVLLNYDWHYVILDEGHKIRNPEAQITVAMKRFQTTHRIILSGSPIQNSLKELWSLFDFVFPGKLGSLPVFLQQFAIPITLGGYANASKLEVQTAFRCATVLRDTINPYLLRRMKIDVRNHLSLPSKEEQVLFCGLTEEQRTLYRQYLDGREVKCILGGRLQVFVGLITLRKLCNHPDLYDGGPKLFGDEVNSLQPELQYGWWKRAGKMIVLHSILRLWKDQSHRVLLFTQSRQMMCILEKFLRDEGYSYLKMDGVGGLGVNLTGADRVVIYDPDWNPSTDTQARERAWRIGQTRHVTIYRLLTAGTIEEKIYHRQIFKQFLTNRVLKDPKQQRFFKTNDLYELFTLQEGEKEKTESSAIFAGTGSEIEIKSQEKDGEEVEEESVAKKLEQQIDSKIDKSQRKETSCSKLDDDREKKAVNRREISSASVVNKDPKLDLTENSTTQLNLGNSSFADLSLSGNGSGELVLTDNSVELNKGITVSECNNVFNKSQLLTASVSHGNGNGNNLEVTSFSPLNCNSVNNNGSSDIQTINTSNDKVDTIIDRDTGISRPNKTAPTDSKKKLDDTPQAIDLDVDNKVKHLINGRTSENVFNSEPGVILEDEKRRKMLLLAKKLSKKIVEHKQESDVNNKGKEKIGREKEDDCGKRSKREKEQKGKKTKKEKKSKTEKDRSKKGKKFEGQRIENLVKKRKFKAATDADEDANGVVKPKSQDDFVLQKLFKKSGVHTALSHDRIIESGDQDYLLIESEADRVAQEALRQVRLSRRECFRVKSVASSSASPIKEKKGPTFGRTKNKLVEAEKKRKKNKISMFNGDVSEVEDEFDEEEFPLPSVSSTPKKQLEDPSSSGTLSSASLLKRMKERNQALILEDKENEEVPSTAGSDSPEADADPDVSSSPNHVETTNAVIDPELEEHVELLTDIRNFVAFQASVDGCASTEEIVGRFRERLPPHRNPVFKALLARICDFIRDSTGKGVWHLKSEFR